MRCTWIVCAVWASVGLCLRPVSASIIFVQQSATGENNGTGWDDAYTNLTLALNAAQGGDSIWVAAGTYLAAVPGDPRSNSFVLRSGVEVYGGFDGTEEALEQRNPALNVTVLSGNDLAYHVIRATDTQSGTVLDGFTIRNGNGTASDTPTGDRDGAGLLISGGTLIVRNCIVRNNTAWSGYFGSPPFPGGHGGGARILNANVTFENCRFEANRAGNGGNNSPGLPPGNGGSGGAIHATDSTLRCVNCTFVGNSGGNGGFAMNQNGGNGGGAGAIYFSRIGSLFLTDCAFISNIAGNGGVNGQDSGPGGIGGSGGAISNVGATQFQVSRCYFSSNRAGTGVPGGGGAISTSNTNCEFYFSTFHNNAAASTLRQGGNGGAIVGGAGRILNCEFLENSAGDATGFGGAAFAGSGGAVYAFATYLIDGCHFEGNRAGDAGGMTGFAGSGGALWLMDSQVYSSWFVDNRAGQSTSAVGGEDGRGGAILNDGLLLLNNSALVGNQTVGNAGTGRGGAIDGSGGSHSILRNSTIAGNRASGPGGGIFLESGTFLSEIEIYNCVLWNNFDINGSGESAQVGGFDSNDSINYSCVQGLSGGWGGTGNIGGDPRFVDLSSADIRLLPGSPCIDAASNPAGPPGILGDVNNNGRYWDDPATVDTGVGPAPIIDMGAAEFGECRADLNGDRTIEIRDLALLLGQFGLNGSGLRADLDGDQDVDLADLSAILINFASDCP